MAFNHKQRRRQCPPKQSGRPAKKQRRQEPAAGFSASRTNEEEEEGEDFPDDDSLNQEENEISADDASNSEDEAEAPANSYASLLRSLKPTKTSGDRPSKRRKLENGDTNGGDYTNGHTSTEMRANAIDDTASAALEEEADLEAEAEEADSDDEETILRDPFGNHYANVVEADLAVAISRLEHKGIMEKAKLGEGMRKLTTTYDSQAKVSRSRKHGGEVVLKKRLTCTGTAVKNHLRAEEQDIMTEIFDYRDILCGCRTTENARKFRDITSLHALNHIFKTRDRVLKNNAKLAQDTNGEADYRDQGFTRPKVLIMVPTKQACVRFVESIVKLSEPDQQENRGRFMDTFSAAEDDRLQHKPDDFQELFGGNHEEDFRVGLKFTRKTIKFFSGFYNSDIILASPLGLMRTVTTGGGKKDKKGHDADFLSSIEVLIIDHANALEMQNWQHVDYVFSQLNLLPKDSHGCDFARVRNWCLDGKARHLRQTIIFSEYITPSISAIATAHLHNTAGRIKYTPVYPGAMLNLSPSIPLTLIQTFLRFDSPSPPTDSDSRFKFFTSTILPSLLRSSNKATNKGTIIYVPTYLDFVRLRNHFSTSQETTSLSFGTISEYSSRGEVARARTHFSHGKHSVLLYSERAHHYFRYKLRAIRRIIFYGVPENPVFWTELIDALGVNAQYDVEWAQSQRGKQGKGLVRALFSKWDMMKLERVVGTERVGRLVSEKEGDVFDFV